jgi:hypothetical protein
MVPDLGWQRRGRKWGGAANDRGDAICTRLNRGDSSSNRIPTIDLESGRCVVGEALSRWRQAAGAVNPEATDLTQDIPLSGRITYW